MQEGLQLPELLARIKVLREAGLRAEHVAFRFMKRRVQPLMARDTLGYEYTGDDDTSRMLGDEVDDDDIVDRLARIFKDMPAYTPCPVPEFSAARPPKEVRRQTRSSQLWIWLAGRCSSHVRAESARCRGRLRMITSSVVAPPS
jgi:hypothetical protein